MKKKKTINFIFYLLAFMYSVDLIYKTLFLDVPINPLTKTLIFIFIIYEIYKIIKKKKASPKEKKINKKDH